MSLRSPVGPCDAREDTNIFCSILLQKLIVEIGINKVVIGSGRGDVPKYMGEGVVLCGVPALWVYHGHGSLLQLFLGNFWWVHFGCATSKVRHPIFGCYRYIIKGCCDIICDITALHVHRSCDLLL